MQCARVVWMQVEAHQQDFHVISNRAACCVIREDGLKALEAQVVVRIETELLKYALRANKTCAKQKKHV